MSERKYDGADEEMRDCVSRIITALGEDVEREGLRDTPERVVQALRFLTQGYRQNVHEVINDAVFEETCDEMVVVKNIEMYSMCEHHLLPFFGKCHIAYLPGNKVIGLSKLARLVDVFSRRLQLQERLTNQIAQALQEHLRPKGVGVIIEAQHLCMMMRGVQRQNSMAVTSCMLGGMKTKQETRLEFLNLVGSSGA